MMKRIAFLLLVLSLLPGVLRAQAIGQVRYEDRIFSTCLPKISTDMDDSGPKMTRERREIALKCVERTFGKIKEYEEAWNDCQECHLLLVTLDSGDELVFYDGLLTRFTIVSPRFSVGADVLRGGGLRVGQKLNLKKSRGEWVIKPVERQDEPGLYRFSPWMDDWSISYLVVDENGIITKIYNWTNDC